MKIVVAYSGGLDTSVILKWLKETYRCEIIAYCADIGQEEELQGLDEKAKATGASKFYALDLVEEFARDFIFPMIQAGAIYENQYFLGASIARPLIAKAQVDIARKENADTVAHGATGKGNDQCRFELTYAALAPDLKIIAPWRLPEYHNHFKGRSEMLAYCEEKGIKVEARAKKPFPLDGNLLSTSPTSPASLRTRGPSRRRTCSGSVSRPKMRRTHRSMSNWISKRAIASPSLASDSH